MWFWNVFLSKKDVNVASDVALASLREVVDDLHLREVTEQHAAGLHHSSSFFL